MNGITLPKPFDGAEHRSFRWKAGDHAALLLHGFPGTPAEMRPLGAVLKDAGWTVHGLMLPGLGADIATLEERRFQDWSDAANQAMAELKRRHSVVILVGYSMGGALALHTATEQRPAGLVLLAPFWNFSAGWIRILWPMLNLFFRRVKPFKHADFSAFDIRNGLRRTFSNIDLDNPQTRQALREISLSLDSIAQVRQLGLRAFKRAARIDVPTLVIQGSQDKVVRPLSTARLVNRFPNSVQYHDVHAAHDLVDPESNAWKQVKNCLLVFAESIRKQTQTDVDFFVSDGVVNEKTARGKKYHNAK